MKHSTVFWTVLLIAAIALGVFLGIFLASMSNDATAAVCTSTPAPDNRLLTYQEVMDLPIGTKVWVEYNPNRKRLWDDEPMIREEKDGVGPVLDNSSGYWELNEKADFGYKYRVWQKTCTEQESKAISWTDSPW